VDENSTYKQGTCTTEGFVIEIVVTVIVSKVYSLIIQTVFMMDIGITEQEPHSVSRDFVVMQFSISNYFIINKL
jgi:hypothetical protein